jgi:dienelactone hydrolase
MHDDPLQDFDRGELTASGLTRAYLRAGAGPAVLLLSEMPGISPEVARLGRWVRDAGFTIFMPSLFGRDGAAATVEAGVEVFKKVCVSAEFRALGEGSERPAIAWLRALARHAHAECGGPGVGVVGMCFTGNFALSMMLQAPTLAPVVCQPSTPLDEPAATGLSGAELEAIRARLEREDLSVLAYRFEGDRWCRAQRFAALSQALGPRFVARVLPDGAANPEPPPFFKHVVGTSHSVLTAHLVDAAGEPTVAARDEVLAFLAQRLFAPGQTA